MNQNLKQATLSDKVPNPTKRKIILIQMENRIIFRTSFADKTLFFFQKTKYKFSYVNLTYKCFLI